MENLIRLHISPAPEIQGAINTNSTLNYTEVTGVSLSQNGFLLAVYGKSELFTATTTKADIKDVNTFNEFFYGFFEKDQKIAFNFTQNLALNTTYSVYMVAFNDDPRKNALTSDLKFVSFLSTDGTNGNSSLLLNIKLLWLFSITALYLHGFD